VKVAAGTAAILVALLALLALGAYRRYFANGPPTQYDDPVRNFKYGSYGSEATGLPYPVWKALPELCPKQLPGGWAQLGLMTEPGQDTPIGTSVRKYGVMRVGLTCASCHAGALEKAGAAPQLIPGMPNPRFDSQGYGDFIGACILSDNFTPDKVFSAIAKVGIQLPFYDRLAYRMFLLGKIRDNVQAAQDLGTWMHLRPRLGPGRTDTANLFRQQLHQNPGGDAIAGAVDYPSLWNQGLRARDGGGQHWDGDNDSYRERDYTSALASGATEESLDWMAVDRVSEWIKDLPAPKYPFAIDVARAQRGRELWTSQRCAECHDFGAPLAGKLTPLDEIGTDPGRLEAFTPATAEAFQQLGVGKPWHITHYKKTHGYLNVWTDGIWARSPYLHNGSVPTLYDLLLPAEQRPREFYRGCAELDPQKVGWKCSTGFHYQTALPGNANVGHRYGTELSDDDRWALVEYMKTL
jgi:mono/diheme cytochrome c family protein